MKVKASTLAKALEAIKWAQNQKNCPDHLRFLEVLEAQVDLKMALGVKVEVDEQLR